MKKKIVKSKKRVPKFQDGVLFNKSMLDVDGTAAKKMDYMKKSLTVDPLKSTSTNTGSDIVNNLISKPTVEAVVNTPKSVAAKNSKIISDSYKKSLQGLMDKGKSIDELVKLGYGTKQGLTNLGLTAPKPTAPKKPTTTKPAAPKPTTPKKPAAPIKNSGLTKSFGTKTYRTKDGKIVSEKLTVKKGKSTLTRTVQGLEKGKKSTYVKSGDNVYYKATPSSKVTKLNKEKVSKGDIAERNRSKAAYDKKKKLGNSGLATGSVQAVDEFWGIGGPGSKLASSGLRKLGNVGVKLLEKRAEKTVKDATGKTVKKGINKLFGKVNADKLKFRSQVNRTQKGGLEKLLNPSTKTPKIKINKTSLKWNANRLQARSRVNKAQKEGLGKLLKR